MNFINGIRIINDPNRGARKRIELLVYHHSGGVTRLHPGRILAQDAEPHMIPHDSRTYNAPSR